MRVHKRKYQKISHCSQQSIDTTIPQFRHIKELAVLKFEAEEKRELSLIQQASQMQTVFSFVTATLYMISPLCIENRGSLSLDFFFWSLSLITVPLVASLVLGLIAQWRWKAQSFPDIFDIKNSIIDDPNWEEQLSDSYQLAQWIDLVGKVQKDKASRNALRANLIMASTICFFVAIGISAIVYIITIIKIF